MSLVSVLNSHFIGLFFNFSAIVEMPLANPGQ